MAPRCWTDPFRRETVMQTIISRHVLPTVHIAYVKGEAPLRERTVIVTYSDGHQTFESIPA